VRTVRDSTFDVLRSYGLRKIFSNPGSTEVSLLTDLPTDFEFVLALHEASVVGMATGFAIANDEPALVVVHTTAGLGNAVGALATARVNRAPLVVLVGQQDRRHLALEPFLAGRDLDRLAGAYPVWTCQPVLARDVPGAVARAWHEARTGRGPAVVVVPMDDWLEPAELEETAAPTVLHRGTIPTAAAVEELAALLRGATAPLVVVGAGLDSAPGWSAAVALVEQLGCPVRQEAFGGRAGFPQDHPRFAGFLPASRGALRDVLAEHDVVLALGAPVFRQYPFAEGRLVPAGVRVAVVTDDTDEAHRSPAELALLADPAEVAARLTPLLPRSASPVVAAFTEPLVPPAPVPGEPLLPSQVLWALAERLPVEAVVVEETPSSRTELHQLLPARVPLGFLSAAMGGLGFALPAAIGVRMGQPDRPVVAVLGDGSSLYAIQGLWSAVHYEVGVLFVVLANERYAIMDHLAEHRGGGSAPWPGFAEVDVCTLAEGLGCASLGVETLDQLTGALDDVLPGLAERGAPLVIVATVSVDVVLDNRQQPTP
jgi:benzoylformate decarboxylase